MFQKKKVLKGNRNQKNFLKKKDFIKKKDVPKIVFLPKQQRQVINFPRKYFRHPKTKDPINNCKENVLESTCLGEL